MNRGGKTIVVKHFNSKCFWLIFSLITIDLKSIVSRLITDWCSADSDDFGMRCSLSQNEAKVGGGA